MKAVLHWLWVNGDVYLRVCPCKLAKWTRVDRLELAGYSVCAKMMEWGNELVRGV